MSRNFKIYTIAVAILVVGSLVACNANAWVASLKAANAAVDPVVKVYAPLYVATVDAAFVDAETAISTPGTNATKWVAALNGLVAVLDATPGIPPNTQLLIGAAIGVVDGIIAAIQAQNPSAATMTVSRRNMVAPKLGNEKQFKAYWAKTVAQNPDLKQFALK